MSMAKCFCCLCNCTLNILSSIYIIFEFKNKKITVA